MPRGTTGDLNGSLATLQGDLRKIKYGGDLDVHSAKQGFPEVYLPLIHFALLGYSRPVAQFISDQGHDLYGKSDLKFIEGTYKVMRDEFNYSPKLTKVQFFSVGFPEQKMIFAGDVIRQCLAKHKVIAKDSKKRAAKSPSKRRRHPPPSSGSPARPPAMSGAGLGRSHAELGPRSDDPRLRVLSQSITSAAPDQSVASITTQVGRAHTNTIGGLNRSPAALRRHDAQMNAAIREAGIAVEREVAAQQSAAEHEVASMDQMPVSELNPDVSRDARFMASHAVRPATAGGCASTDSRMSHQSAHQDSVASSYGWPASANANASAAHYPGARGRPLITAEALRPGEGPAAAYSQDDLSIQTLYAPEDYSAEHFEDMAEADDSHVEYSAVPPGAANGGWATSSLSHGPTILPAREQPVPASASVAGSLDPSSVVQSLERLANCVTALSSRVGAVELDALGSVSEYPNVHSTSMPAAPPANQNFDWLANDLRSMMSRIEQRLDNLDANYSQTPARITLMEQKMQALEVFQAQQQQQQRRQLAQQHYDPTYSVHSEYNLRPGMRPADAGYRPSVQVTRNAGGMLPTAAGSLNALNRSLSALENTAATSFSDRDRTIQSPSRPTANFRPPSTSSPKQPMKRRPDGMM